MNRLCVLRPLGICVGFDYPQVLGYGTRKPFTSAMAMKDALRTLFVKRLVENIEVIAPGARFERFGGIFLDYYLNTPLGHRGLNLLGNPVGHTVDTISDDEDVAAEYTIDKKFFDGDMDKARKDLEHVRQRHSRARHVFLLCTETAGPKRYEEIVREAGEHHRTHGVQTHLYDGRRIAEAIIDHLILNDSAIEALAEYLPALKQIRDEHEASHLVPDPGNGYISRPSVEGAIADALAAGGSVVIAGIGGSGKSQCAAAVAAAQRKNFDLIIWQDASQLEGVEQLHSLPVARSGASRNVAALLGTLRCLLILDDVRVTLDRATLEALCRSGSKILVTTRRAEHSAYRLPLLDREVAQDLLSRGIDGGCPADVFDTIWSTVGGHPLTLRLMNAAIVDGSASWKDLIEDCQAVSEFVDDRQERVADRILKRLMPLLSRELSLFSWAGQSWCDREFARHVIQPVGLRKLQSYCLTAPDAGANVRLHDIVFASLASSPEIIDTNRRCALSDLLEGYIKSVYELDFELIAVCHGMKGTLERLVRGGDRRAAFLYGLLIGWDPSEFDSGLIGDVAAYVEHIANDNALEPIAVSVALEAIEALYRHESVILGADAAKSHLRDRLPIFGKLAQISGLSVRSDSEIRHHRGKALKLVGETAEAVKEFEAVLAGPCALPATRLQLLRIYAKEKKYSERAQELVSQILRDAQENPHTIASSIVLGSIESLSGVLPPNEQKRVYGAYGDLIEERLLASAMAGSDQAYQAFAVIGRYWAWNEPTRFKNVLNSLPRRSVADATRDYDRSAYGEILLEAASVELPETERIRMLEDSLQFFDAISNPKPFQLRKKGEVLVKMSRWGDAEAILESLDGREEPWRGYWLAKAKLGAGKPGDALANIDAALAKLERTGQYWSTFMALRYEIRDKLGDTKAIEDLREAVATCPNERYRAILVKRLAAAERHK